MHGSPESLFSLSSLAAELWVVALAAGKEERTRDPRKFSGRTTSDAWREWNHKRAIVAITPEHWPSMLSELLSEQRDPVILDLPYGRTPAFLLEKAVGKTITTAALEVVHAHIPDTTECWLLVPEMVLTSGLEADFRDVLFRVGVLSIVFANATTLGVGEMHHRQRMALVHIASRSEKDAEPRDVLLVDGDALIASCDGVETAGNLLREMEAGHCQDDRLGYVYTWDLPRASLSFGRYSPELERALATLQRQAPLSNLGEIAAVVPGVPLRQAATEAGAASDSVKVITGRDIAFSTDRELEPSLLEKVPDPGRRYHLQPHDIVVPSFVPKNGLKAVIVPSRTDRPLVAQNSTIRIRLHEPSRELAEHVVDLLMTDVATRWIEAHSHSLGNVSRLSAKILRELPTPASKPQLVRVNAELRGAISQLRDLANYYEEQRRDLALFEDPAELLDQTQYPVALATHVREFVQSVHTLTSLVRNTFPLPLALAWRRIEIEQEPKQRYDEILKAAENLIVYLATMLLADLRTRNVQAGALGVLADSLAKPAGLGWGIWKALLHDFPRSRESDPHDESCFPELQRTLRKDNTVFWSTLGKLYARRNDSSHQRGPRSARDSGLAAKEAEGELRALFEECLFLARYPLRWVTHVRFDELKMCRTIRYIELRGDHELLPTQEEESSEECGAELYFLDKDGELRLVSPWLLFDDCPTCGHREVYVPDKVVTGGGRYRSLTTSHGHDVDESRWGRLHSFLNVARAKAGVR